MIDNELSTTDSHGTITQLASDDLRTVEFLLTLLANEDIRPVELLLTLLAKGRLTSSIHNSAIKRRSRTDTTTGSRHRLLIVTFRFNRHGISAEVATAARVFFLS